MVMVYWCNGAVWLLIGLFYVVAVFLCRAVLSGCVIVCRLVRCGLRRAVNSVGMFSCYLIFICVVVLVACFASIFPGVMVCWLAVFVLFGDWLLVWICYLDFGFVVVFVVCVFMCFAGVV